MGVGDALFECSESLSDGLESLEFYQKQGGYDPGPIKMELEALIAMMKRLQVVCDRPPEFDANDDPLPRDFSIWEWPKSPEEAIAQLKIYKAKFADT